MEETNTTTKKRYSTRIYHKIKKIIGKNAESTNTNANTNQILDVMELIVGSKEQPLETTDTINQENKIIKRTNKETNMLDLLAVKEDDDERCCCIKEIKIVKVRGLKGEKGDKGDNAINNTFIHISKNSDQPTLRLNTIIWDKMMTKLGDCDIITPSSDLLLWTPGYYYIIFNIYHQNPCQFTLCKNKIPLSHCIMDFPTIASQNSSNIIINITSEDVTQFPTSLSPTGTAALIHFKNTSCYYVPLLNNVNNRYITTTGKEPTQIMNATIIKIA